jgi:flagellin-specific chaperone FliS
MNPIASQVHTYLEQELTAKSPEELLLFLLETGVRAARRRDRKLVIGVLTELMGGLDFSKGEVSTGLVSLYDYAVREARENRFEFPEKLLSELAETFKQVAAGRMDGAGDRAAA